MNGDRFDVAIVGNGILGLTLAYRLKNMDPKLNVVLIGPKQRPGSATLAAGAMINLWAEVCEGQFENPALAERFDLTLGGNDRWDNFAEELSQFSDIPLKIIRGTYILQNAKGTAIEDRAYRYIKQMLKEKNVEHRTVSPEDIRWFKPAADCRAIDMTWIPDGRIDSRKVVQALDRAMEAKGVKYYPIKATGFTASTGFLSGLTGGQHKLTLEDGTIIKANDVVLANGAFAQDLIDQVDDLRHNTPRLLFGGGAGINLEFPPWVHKYGGMGREIFDMECVIRTTDRGGACGIHVVPYGNGNYYLGASSGVWTDPDMLPKIHGVHNLIHGVLTEISRAFFFAGVELRGNGFRPVTTDCFPLLGESHMKGVWFMNGTKRDGFTMSPYISQEIARGILGQKHNLPERFRPSRKLISYKDKESAIKATELMYEGSDFQHGGLTVTYMVDSYNAMRKKSIEDTYKKRNIENFGIHPEVLHLYDNDDFYQLIDHAREVQ